MNQWLMHLERTGAPVPTSSARTLETGAEAKNKEANIMKYYLLLATMLAVISLPALANYRSTALHLSSERTMNRSDKTNTEPSLFAEGVISTGEMELNAAFTPDGKTLYFTKRTPRPLLWVIVVS